MKKNTLKVNVTAAADFYDKGNAIPRKKGDEFVLRRDYAESLGKQVKIGEAIPDREPEKPAPQPQAKGKGGPQGKDISMDNITTEDPPAPKAKKKAAKLPAKKGK